MGHLAQMLGADVRRHPSKESQVKAFGLLVEYARKLETVEPEDGKNVTYYVDRFHNAELMKHRVWFADELAKYCERMEEAS